MVVRNKSKHRRNSAVNSKVRYCCLPLDRGQASTTNAPPYTKLKEIGNAINLGSHAWLKLAGILSMLHEMEQFVLDAFTCPRLDGALCMNCIAPGPILCKTSCQSHVHYQNTNSSNRMQIDATKLPPNDCID